MPHAPRPCHSTFVEINSPACSSLQPGGFVPVRAGTLCHLGEFLFLFAVLLLTWPEENDLISPLCVPNLHNGSNFAYLSGTGEVLMLPKELKGAQMKDAVDTKSESSRLSLWTTVPQNLTENLIRKPPARSLPSRHCWGAGSALQPWWGAARAVISCHLLSTLCRIPNYFSVSVPGCLAGRTLSEGKINNEPKRQLALSLTRRGGDNRPMRIMICAESFATSVSEALSFIQGLSHPNYMRDDSVNTSTPAKAAVMKSVSVAPAPNSTWKSRCVAQIQFITVWAFLTYKTKGWIRKEIPGSWKLQ